MQLTMVKLMIIFLMNRQVMKLIGLYEVIRLKGVTYHTTYTFKTLYAPALKLFEIHLLEQELTLAEKNQDSDPAV
jgi:hypothetical protein